MAFFQRIYQVVHAIPPGKVASYGQVAALAGNPRAARTVGWALHVYAGDAPLPWHRVVNAQGKISLRRQAALQMQLLVNEGIEFDDEDCIDLHRFGWQG